jgi:hypothetical protein
MTDTSGSSSEQERLDRLQDRIDDVREDVNAGTELDDEPRFIDDGDESDVVDDTIAPG